MNYHECQSFALDHDWKHCLCYAYRVEVIADSSGQWCGNGKLFLSIFDAVEYGRDLFSRWTAVRECRVVNKAGGMVKKVA